MPAAGPPTSRPSSKISSGSWPRKASSSGATPSDTRPRAANSRRRAPGCDARSPETSSGRKRAILESFLEVSDNLDRAVEAGRQAAAGDALLSGVELVRELLQSTLARHGVARIEAAGQPFDPTLHDAVATVPVTEPERDGAVVEVIKPGYAVGDDVLRPASVAVGKIQN